MARKKKHEEHENHERWLVSYADFITLLFAFFVVMYSLSAINEGRFRVLAESLASAFRSTPKAPHPVQIGQPLRTELLNTPEVFRAPPLGLPAPLPTIVPPKPLAQAQATPAGSPEEQGAGRAMRQIADRVEKAMAPLVEKDLVTVRRFRYWVEIEIKTNILFASGSALLDRQALPVLRSLADILKEYPNRIQVEGFTDNQPIRSAVYPSNWELSAARAMSVVHMFAREKVDPARLSAVGFGEYRPVAANDAEEGRALNRRVVLVVLAGDDDVERLRGASPDFGGAMGQDSADNDTNPTPAPGPATVPSPGRSLGGGQDAQMPGRPGMAGRGLNPITKPVIMPPLERGPRLNPIAQPDKPRGR